MLLGFLYCFLLSRGCFWFLAFAFVFVLLFLFLLLSLLFFLLLFVCMLCYVLCWGAGDKDRIAIV